MALSFSAGLSLHRRERGRHEERVGDRGDDRAGLLGLSARRLPFWIGAEFRHLGLALGERFPFEEIGEVHARWADQRREKSRRMDRVLFPQLQGNRVEAL